MAVAGEVRRRPIWVIQEEHLVHAPPAHAEELLKRLLGFNLTWRMLSYGAILVPLFAVSCYFAQNAPLLGKRLWDCRAGRGVELNHCSPRACDA